MTVRWFPGYVHWGPAFTDSTLTAWKRRAWGQAPCEPMYGPKACGQPGKTGSGSREHEGVEVGLAQHLPPMNAPGCHLFRTHPTDRWAREADKP